MEKIVKRMFHQLFMISFILAIFYSCGLIKNNLNKNISSKWITTEIKKTVASHFDYHKKINVFVLEFQNALQQNRYYIFDKNNVFVYEIESDTNGKYFFIEKKYSKSSYMSELIQKVIQGDKLMLNGDTESCQDCYSVVLYKLKYSKPRIKFINIEVLSKNYIGPL